MTPLLEERTVLETGLAAKSWQMGWTCSGKERGNGALVHVEGDDVLERELAGLDELDQRLVSRDGGRACAVDVTVILLHPPSIFGRCFNRDGEGMSAK